MRLETYVVHVTKECNCACLYCYEQDKTSIYSWAGVKELLDNFIKYHPTKQFNIEFLGGEPMLAWDLIRKTIEYTKFENPVNVNKYIIITNGTIIPDDFVEVMENTPNLCWAASLDGNYFMNQLRVFKDGINTYDTVISNFKYLKSKLKNPEKRLGVHMVTHPYNIGHLHEGVDHLYNIGFRNIGIGTIESTIEIGKEYCDRFIKEMDFISEKIRNNKYKDIHIDILQNRKSREDVRYYIKDKNGKVLGESYGRSGDDIVKNNNETQYNAIPTSSPLGNMISDIREIAYNNHQIRMNNA